MDADELLTGGVVPVVEGALISSEQQQWSVKFRCERHSCFHGVELLQEVVVTSGSGRDELQKILADLHVIVGLAANQAEISVI